MSDSQKWRLRLVVDKLKAGAVIAYPTEGVWGLGCVPENQAAVEKILRLKRRPVTKGLILVAASIEQILPYCRPLSVEQKFTLKASWPGPVTYLIDKSGATPAWISGDSNKVAVRVSNHPLVRDLCNKLGGPLVSTSANPAGKVAAMNVLKLKQYFGDQLDYIFPGRLGGQTGSSEIIDLATGKVLRPGGQN